MSKVSKVRISAEFSMCVADLKAMIFSFEYSRDFNTFCAIPQPLPPPLPPPSSPPPPTLSFFLTWASLALCPPCPTAVLQLLPSCPHALSAVLRLLPFERSSSFNSPCNSPWLRVLLPSFGPFVPIRLTVLLCFCVCLCVCAFVCVCVCHNSGCCSSF